ncbi:MAG: putative transporter small subunit [Pseudoclavibacter sp.]
MSTIALTVYVLAFPVIVLGVMIVIGRAFIKEWIEARKEGRSLI